MKKKSYDFYSEDLIVVVPDGLRIGRNNRPYLTNTYRKVLKRASLESKNFNLKILLLPANNFGTKKSEELVGKEYLLRQGVKENMIIIGLKNKKSYLDTLDNFNQVILNEGSINNKKFNVSSYLKQGKFKLITSYLHSKRILNVISLLNLEMPKEIICIFSKESGRIPFRLIYYKYPLLHFLYEIIAIIYQNFKIYIMKF